MSSYLFWVKSRAYVIYFGILATAGATNLLLVALLIPISAIGLGHLFLGEHLQPRHMAGLALIVLGLGAIDGRVLTVLGRRGPQTCRSAAHDPKP